MDNSPAIRCRGLVKEYGTVRAVNGLDLEIPSGECFGLLGPNGAGKTTTIEILEGLLPATSGEVELLGCNWKTDRGSLRQRLGISYLLLAGDRRRRSPLAPAGRRSRKARLHPWGNRRFGLLRREIHQ